MGTKAWPWAADPTPWKRLWLFCPGCLHPWPGSWAIASSHGGQQMCTAGGGALGGIQSCPVPAWARELGLWVLVPASTSTWLCGPG